MAEISTRDIVALLEAGKRKAELEFRKAIFEDASEGLAKDLRKVEDIHRSLAARMERAGIELAYPFGKRIEEFNKSISGITPGEIRDAMRSRDGPVYGLLAERGIIIKKNFENRENIAKATMIISRLDEQRRRRIFDAIRCGALAENVSVADLDEKSRARLARLIRRMGIRAGVADGFISGEAVPAEDEVQVQVLDKKVWVTVEVSGLLSKNLEDMDCLNRKIQLRNAQRQVMSFNDDEEKDFATLQSEYLRLLKEQDELLREFKEEEMTVTG